MANFDFIDSASRGYVFTWLHRSYLMRIAMIPLVLKIVLYWLIVFLNLENDLLRQGLILIPSYFAEGWLVAVAVRMAIYNEYNDIQITGNPKLDQVRMKERFQAMKACMVIYVLTKLVGAFFIGLGMQANAKTSVDVQEMPEPGYDVFFVVLAMLALAIWVFRFFWLYIPACMGYPLRAFLKKINPYFVSVSMVALWLLCLVPIGFVMVLVSQLLVGVFPIVDGDPSRGYLYALGTIQSFFEIVITIVASVGMAYAFQSYLFGQDENS